MAVDGRDIARARAGATPPGLKPPSKPPERDAYTSPVVRVLSQALVWIPAALVVWFAYVSGTWAGGWTMGVASVLSAVLTVVLLWGWYKMRRRRH